jgi:hypothetical protein
MSGLVFLGTGGGRFAAILQARATGGIHLQLDGPDGQPRRFQIDPGPGALVRMLDRGIDPSFFLSAQFAQRKNFGKKKHRRSAPRAPSGRGTRRRLA